MEYPFDVDVLEGASDATVDFQGTISNIDETYPGELPEIRAATDSVVLFEPGPRDNVSDEIELRGMGYGLEGSISYELWGHEKLTSGFFGAGARPDQWEPFETTIELPEEAEDHHVLQLRLMDYGMKFTSAPTLVVNLFHSRSETP